MRAQASLEHLAILGVALFIVIPATVLFYNYARTSNERVIKTQITRIGDEITRAAETMAIVGPGSHVVLKLNLPEAVDDLYIAGDTLVIKYHTFSGPGQEMYFSDVKMFGPCTYPPDLTRLDPNPCPNDPGALLTTVTDRFHDGLLLVKVQAVSRANQVHANVSEAP